MAVASDGSIGIAWQSEEHKPQLHFSQSSDHGKTWSASLEIPSMGSSAKPVLAIAADNSLHLAWIEAADVFYSSSTDAGKTWSKEINISKTPGNSFDPAIAVGADGTVHVAWLDSTSGVSHPDIYYAKKSAGEWSEAKNISNSPRFSSHPALACGSGERTYLIWSDNSKREVSADIWCARARKGGNFGKLINVSNTAGISTESTIAADNHGQVVVVWSDTTHGETQPDIFARIAKEHLDTISAAIDLTNTPGKSVHPSVCIQKGKLFVAWEEGQEGKSSIKVTAKEITGVATGPSFGVEGTRVFGHPVEF